MQAALEQARRGHGQELGEVKASAARQLRAEKTAARHAVQAFARDLLPVTDGMDRAVEQEHGDAAGWRQGVGLVRSSLEAALAQHGVVPVEAAQGDGFEPREHECISELPAESESAALTVVAVQRRGWKLHDRLLRPAEVVTQRLAEASEPAMGVALPAPCDESSGAGAQKASDAPDGGEDHTSPDVAVVQTVEVQ